MSPSNRTGLKIAAALFGVVVTGAGIVFFNVWLKAQGGDEAELTAAWALTAAEARLGEAVAALQKLAGQGVNSCEPAQREAMRQAVLRTAPIKQVVLLSSGAQVLCSGTEASPDRQELVSSASKGDLAIMLDVVRIVGSDARFLRVRSDVKRGQPSLAALLPPSLLLPQASLQGGPWTGYARIALPGGAIAGEIGASRQASQDGQRVVTLRSERYPLIVSVAAAERAVIASRDDLSRVAIVMSGGLALVILLFALMISKRRGVSPIDDIAKAIRDNQFVPFYQPVVDLQSGRLLGAEVLARWRRSDGTFVEPNSFVLALETNDVVLDLTRKLMVRVCKDLGEAVGQRPAMTIAINIAPKHFDDAVILHDVGSIFNGSPIRLNQLVLELTERHEVVNFTSMRRTVAALQRIGCRIAIDDVGTGHSGLSYILKLGADIIKMDKMFVDAIGNEGHTKAIIETLIDLAKNLRMEIIAEGVETFDQVTYLRERGITAAQGYVFAPPLPAATFLQLLEAMDPLADAPGDTPAAAAG